MATVKAFFEKDTCTCQYVVSCDKTKECFILDTVMGFDPVSGRTNTKDTVDPLIEYVKENGFKNQYVLETHAHADHMSAAPYVKQQVGGQIGIGEHIEQVQEVFKEIFNIDDLPKADTAFDVLFKDGQKFKVGEIDIEILHTPGHTPACIAYYSPSHHFVFTGDTMFMPDQGTARCDFPGGSAETLWASIQKILALPKATKVYTCHDYAPGGREYKWESTIAEELAENKHVKEGTLAEQFITWRADRDKELNLPRLIVPSIQCNINAGRLPAPEKHGKVYLKTPVNTL